MVSKIYSAALNGISAQMIEIEAAASQGLRSFNIVGLADKAIEEAKERVGAAIKSVGLSPPFHQTKRVLISLAPADIKKQGSLYDLPIALCYLLASRQTKFNPEKKLILGELALDGKLKPIRGAVNFALLALEKNFSEIVLPKANEKEACLISFLNPNCDLKIVGIETLKQAIGYLEGREKIPALKPDFSEPKKNREVEIRFSWIKGQEHAKRGLEIAAAGGHNILFQGPPGAGKTLLAKSTLSILPELDKSEILELTKIYSSAGLLNPEEFFVNQRPFRAPHHSCSEPALIGGGNPIKPGEITLAHRGVLFLDEFPEFHRDVLESLRGPLEQGTIQIQMAQNNLFFPANFTLIAAANPCPCGNRGNPDKECVCTNSQIASYRRKLSGPLMDRIDIFCWVPALKYKELVAPDQEDKDQEIRAKITRARNIQKQRFAKSGLLTNSEMSIPDIKKYCQIDSSSENILQKYVDSGRLSARGYHRVLKLARTIADLGGQENISFDNVNEALSYRLREEEY